MPACCGKFWINLLGNSMKFTAAGEVRLTVTADAPARPDEPHLLRFSVADTGPGIDSETQQRLFQPFQQGGSGTVQAVGDGQRPRPGDLFIVGEGAGRNH